MILPGLPGGPPYVSDAENYEAFTDVLRVMRPTDFPRRPLPGEVLLRAIPALTNALNRAIEKRERAR